MEYILINNFEPNRLSYDYTIFETMTTFELIAKVEVTLAKFWSD